MAGGCEEAETGLMEAEELPIKKRVADRWRNSIWLICDNLKKSVSFVSNNSFVAFLNWLEYQNFIDTIAAVAMPPDNSKKKSSIRHNSWEFWCIQAKIF